MPEIKSQSETGSEVVLSQRICNERGDSIKHRNDFRRRSPWLLALIVGMALPACAWGQSELLGRVYGEGVHQYFRGDAKCAKETFDKALAHGSRDPRVHYFRGLANLGLGFALEGQDDFRMGAKLEVDGAGTYDIDRALERIQGSQRLCLESVRLETKLALSQRRPSLLPDSDPDGLPSGSQTLPGFGRDLPPAAMDPFADDDVPPKMEILEKEESPDTTDASETPDNTETDNGALFDEDANAFGAPDDSAPLPADEESPPTDTPPTADPSAEEAFDDPFGSDTSDPFEEPAGP